MDVNTRILANYLRASKRSAYKILTEASRRSMSRKSEEKGLEGLNKMHDEFQSTFLLKERERSSV